ncbi:MAG: 30S ribosomal protein S15 [Anaerolineae bacterium]
MSITKDEKAQIISEFGTHEGDTGSAQVQIAILTHLIQTLTEHMKVHHHDFHSQRGLLTLVGRRRRLLKYLRQTQPEEYEALIQRLGLRR